MLRMCLVIILCAEIVIFTCGKSARAKDVALILNDQEQTMLYQALDGTVRAQGLNAAPSMLHLLDRLRSAPIVTDTKIDAPKGDDKGASPSASAPNKDAQP